MTSPAAGVDFDHKRIPQGELIAGVAGVLLIIFEFFDWYGGKASGTIGGVHVSRTGGGADAWQAFSFIDILLFVLALVAIGVAVMRGLNRLPEMPYPPSILVTGAGGLAVLLILYRIISKPDFGGIPSAILGVHFSVTLKIGIFLALLSAAGIAYGGWQSMQASGASFSDMRGGGEAGTPPPAMPDPVPGQTAGETPPGLAGDPHPPEGAGGTTPPGL
jgi:hypothetical protein